MAHPRLCQYTVHLVQAKGAAYLLEQELEGNAVDSGLIGLEMYDFDKVTLVRLQFLVRDPLCDNIRVVVYAEHRIVRPELAMQFVVMNFVDAYPSALLLIRKASLLAKGQNEILDVALLIDQNVVSILQGTAQVSTECNSRASQLPTSLVIPSDSQVTLMFFLVSSSARLISSTSKNSASPLV